ncbi:MAG: hypothetical protein BWK79_00110 [Beggiatoa sp. IS2]|nr:MAG: hypothetical protein BWK79_00110 [Beggiatoa sp. IS2]
MQNDRAASVSSQAQNLSIDLCALIECLHQAIPAIPNSDNVTRQSPLFKINTQELAIAVNLDSILSRLTELFNEKKCQALVQPGFIRDLGIPKSGQREYYGGQIVEGTEDRLTKAVDKLVKSIDTELDTVFCEDFTPNKLLIQDVAKHLEAIAKNIGIKKFVDSLSNDKMKLQPVRLDTSPSDISHNKGRVFTSTEMIEGNREIRLNQLIRVCHDELKLEIDDNSEIIHRCERLRREAEQDFNRETTRPENQINRFLKFLDDTALARVRLVISISLLNNIADYLVNREKQDNLPKKATVWQLVEYAQRVQLFFDYFTGEQPPLIDLNLSAHFSNVDSLLDEEVMNIGFFNALPIFPEPNAQLFEQFDKNPARTLREVSYRFRINGNNSEGKSAFLARLERIRDNLSNPGKNIKRFISQLILLCAVIPAENQQHLDKVTLRENVEERIRKVVDKLKNDGPAGAKKLLARLTERAAVFDVIAKSLIEALRLKGSALSELTTHSPKIFYVNVRPGLINATELAGNMKDILSPIEIEDRNRPEQIHFLKHIRISPNAPQTDALMSFKVEVKLSESYLVTANEVKILQAGRILPNSLVQILWQPLEDSEDSEPYKGFIHPRQVVFLYHNGLLKSKETNEQSIQLLAAYRAAFTILSYVITLRLLRRITETCEQKPHVLVLRLQTGKNTGDGDDFEKSANGAVYAASQAYEHLINRDYPCRLQGLVTKQDNLFYRKRNAFYALCAGFPLKIDGRVADSVKSLTPVGVITFTDRYANVHPEDNPEQRGFTVVMQIYVLKRTETGYEMHADGMKISLVTGEEKARQPELIMNEIRRLQAQGIQHIIYLAHRFGERRHGRAHQRERVYDDAVFLNKLYATFSNLVLYPLVRDVFPTVRLYKKDPKDSTVYEIVDVGSKGYRLPEGINELRGNYTPIYSIGTLRIVGLDEDKKPQSGICTYFLLNDAGPEDDERMQRIRSHLLLSDYGGRADLIMALRAIHFLENEENQLRPVLDPYRWLSPDSLEQAGDIPIKEKTHLNNDKPVVLSLRAILARISDILHKDSFL